MNNNQTNKPISIEQAAAYTGYTKSYLYKLVHEKKIPHYKPEGGRILFSLADLEKFCFRNRQAAEYELQDKAESILNGGQL
jgi:excisionase family DNA binding protein